MNNKALVDSFENQSIMNNYENFPGEKIPLDFREDIIDGDWGTLKLVPFILQPSVDFVAEQSGANDILDLYDSGSEWLFKGAGLEDIRTLFQEAGLSKEVCGELMLNTRAMLRGKGCITTPPDKILWSFTPEIRSKLYSMIGVYSDNTMYSQPICFNSQDSGEWFYNSNLNKEVAEKLLSLVYYKDGICNISDIHLILPFLKSDDDRISLLQTLYRTKAVDAYLEVRKGQDVSQMVEYWGNLGRTEAVGTILEGISSNPGGGKIDITGILPQIPQDRLNTYSGIEEYIANFKDCHWTTINFFNNEPDERYYDYPDFASFINMISALLENTQPKFGDIIMIYDKNNELTHSCTYIADNLVLTKNGMGNLKPFVLTYLDKTIPLYGDKIVYLSRTVSNTNRVELRY